MRRWRRINRMIKRISKEFEAYSEESLQKNIEQYAHDNDLNIICAVGTKVVKKRVMFEHSFWKKLKRRFSKQ